MSYEVEDMNDDNFRAHASDYLRLCVMTDEELDGQAADDIRDAQPERSWYQLSEKQKERIAWLSESMYLLGDLCPDAIVFLRGKILQCAT